MSVYIHKQILPLGHKMITGHLGLNNEPRAWNCDPGTVTLDVSLQLHECYNTTETSI